MKLTTNIKIDYPTGVDSKGNDFVTLKLGTKAFMRDMSVHVNFEYSVPNEDFKAEIAPFKLGKEDLQAMYDSVKSGLPSAGTKFAEYIETMFLKAAKTEMINTFSGLTATTEIDIV